jgi:hypothetical protein
MQQLSMSICESSSLAAALGATKFILIIAGIVITGENLVVVWAEFSTLS